MLAVNHEMIGSKGKISFLLQTHFIPDTVSGEEVFLFVNETKKGCLFLQVIREMPVQPALAELQILYTRKPQPPQSRHFYKYPGMLQQQFEHQGRSP